MDDIWNIILFSFIYIMQGIPRGLLKSLPLILKAKNATYAELGAFSWSSWPFAISLLWAPLIDVFYFKKLGRRKSWIVPIELLLGVVAISSANYLNSIFDSGRTQKTEDIYMLTIIFIVITTLAATHDIALDGWVIELLLKENVAWQSTCNSIGHFIGGFFGDSLFILLESADFCNKYLRSLFKLPPQTYGFANIGNYFYVYGSLMLITAILILVFKNEKNLKKQKLIEKQLDNDNLIIVENEEQPELKKHSLIETYRLIVKLMFLSPIKRLIFILITIRIGMATEIIVRVRLIEEGVSRVVITQIGLVLTPLTIIIPIVLNRFVHGPKPFNIIIKTHIFKLFVVLAFSGFVFITPILKSEKNTFPFFYFIIYFILNCVSAICNFIYVISLGSFFANISDKSIGGTYMTFLSMWTNIGLSISRTSVLYLTSFLTFKYCRLFSYISNDSPLNINATNLTSNNAINATSVLTSSFTIIKNNTCSTKEMIKSCAKMGAECYTKFDGFYFLTFVLISCGFIWLILCRRMMLNLQTLPKSVWLVSNKAKPPKFLKRFVKMFKK